MSAYLIGQIIIHDMGKFMPYTANTSAAIANDDESALNTGFPPHGHTNMEIITYVSEGA